MTLVVPQIGVGIQYNPEILDWFPFDQAKVDCLEILMDSIMGPLDSPYVLLPSKIAEIESLRKGTTLIAHSNYGGEFGFGPLEESAAVLRHAALAKELHSPWVSDHSYYGDASWVDIWSSPLQFSSAEVRRLAPRCRRLQEIYGIPLAHENAAYYMPCPGSDMAESDFMAELVESAGTYLHLDIHNLYANSLNFPSFDIDAYLERIPLDRVLEIHVSGGSWMGGLYHDWHDSRVPERVWEILQFVLERSSPGAVILEVQGRAHHPDTRVLTVEDDLEMVLTDLETATQIWDGCYGAASRLGATATLGR